MRYVWLGIEDTSERVNDSRGIIGEVELLAQPANSLNGNNTLVPIKNNNQVINKYPLSIKKEREDTDIGRCIHLIKETHNSRDHQMQIITQIICKHFKCSKNLLSSSGLKILVLACQQDLKAYCLLAVRSECNTFNI